eukprot:m51a1_g10331 putative beta-galactosidase (325) ;mRNA; r:97537-98757
MASAGCLSLSLPLLLALLLQAPCSGASIASPVLFAYFRTGIEAMHYAVSTDGLNFTALNDNQPVFVSGLGSRRIRDPYIARSPRGGWEMVATDGWASDSVLHWHTDDLVRWTAGELAPVMRRVNGTQQSWAPEWVWYAERQQFLVFWSSETPQAVGKRIWGAWTDFRGHWSESFVVMDPGFNCIDADTTRVAEGQWEMYFKDERGSNVPTTDYKAGRRTTGPSPAGPWGEPSGLLTDHLTEGFELLHLPGNPTGQPWLLYYDCFGGHHFGVSHSDDRAQWKQVEGSSCAAYGGGVQFPDLARHGSFVQVTDEQLAVILKAFPEH